ncbi:PREDICTED: uncharacterized protein K02A2.6-like [Priapulus caudatus]|uniref:RNA-directed DNA polymerase n=1 Tax=Priapulus caudatus TaxID=37621 RepID=A0ABM1E7Z4_PRICU|nr:PREDICTED: uncharacterized protein K02A2.6-like [Priapulus caudatus]
MMLRVQKYDVEIKYVPGKDIPLADALSRISPCPGDTVQGLDVSVHELHLHLNASPTRIEQIKDATSKDDVLHSLRSLITQGWPSAEKCKLRAKGSVFWANISKDIEEMVKDCPPCQHNQKANMKEPLMPHDVPPRPWHTLGSDLFFWNNSSYLLVSDYYSKFPLVRKLNNIRSDTTIAHMKSIFDEYGIPSKLVTGNDTQFTSALFQKFSETYGFDHVTTSPYYPQANGFIERTVQTVKALLQKCKESNTDPHIAMLCLRSTSLQHNIPSAAELLNSRVYQTNLPATRAACTPCLVVVTLTRSYKRQEKQKLQHDKPSKTLSVLHPEFQQRPGRYRIRACTSAPIA